MTRSAGLLFMARFGSVEKSILDAVELCLWQTFGLETRLQEELHDPAFAYDGQRRQYSSVLMLRELVRLCPPDARKYLAVTETDLFIPMLSFVYGQAQLQGTVALVSLARLRQEFYGLPPNPVLLLARALKECVHEMGHTFGLIHCKDTTCPMSLSTNIRQLDIKGSQFCRACAIMLQENTAMLTDNTGERR